MTVIAEQLKPLAVPLDTLNLDPSNARIHPQKNMDAIRASLAQFGQRKPIVVQKAGMIVRAGNGTVEAARALGWSEIAAVVLDDDNITATAYAIADNRTGELAEWDDDILASLVKDLEDFDLGFSEKDLSSLETYDDEEQEAPPLPEGEPCSKYGAVYHLGDHVLMCGDCLDKESVSVLMGDHTASLCLTDPPYSVDYGNSHIQRGGKESVHSPYKEGRTPTSILEFMSLVPSDVMIWSFPVDRHFQELAKAYERHEWEFKKELVWAKDVATFWPGAKYQQKHEPIMISTRKGFAINGDVPASETTVREANKPKNHDLHPTARPIELWEPLMRFHSSKGEIVYDPFLGSGTTLICAARLGRVCYGMEIAPSYCDVIRKRWGDWARSNGVDPGDDAL